MINVIKPQLTQLKMFCNGPVVAIKPQMGPLQNIVIFGSGMVSGPAIEYISKKHRDKMIKVVSCDTKEIALMKNRFVGQKGGPAPFRVFGEIEPKNIQFIHAKLDCDSNTIGSFLNDAVCCLSLLPATMHPLVAKSCLSKKVPMVTASYVGSLRDFDTEAKRLNVPILCEMGLDPGLDHMSCKQIIDATCAQVVSFESYCGGLPAPESAGGPLGYKLSWSPRGVLTALKASAKYIKNGRVYEVGKVLESRKQFHLSNPYMALDLESMPNRDSTIYADAYGIDLRNVDTFFRGTLRYKGFIEIMLDFQNHGWLDESKSERSGQTWRDVCDSSNFSKKTLEFLEPHLDLMVHSGPKMDSLCHLFKETLQMQPDDRDMVLMEHRIGFRNGTTVTSTLVEFGTKQDTAMAKTVGITAAIGVDLLITKRAIGGIHLPTEPWVYQESLTRLRDEGIYFHETVTRPR